jgi:hypothetical protein
MLDDSRTKDRHPSADLPAGGFFFALGDPRGLGLDTMAAAAGDPESTGSSGNFGTIDMGPANNSAVPVSKRIGPRLSRADLDQLGGELRLDDGDELH